MKISRLIEILGQRMDRHGDREVETTWEGSTHKIDPASIYKTKADVEFCSNLGIPADILVIDADDNFYKPKVAADPNEGVSGDQMEGCRIIGVEGSTKTTDHPWDVFLRARADLIDWLHDDLRQQDWEIARTLSMDAMQVKLIRERSR